MKISLRRRHAPMVTNGAFGHKILNLEGHQNHITGSRVTAILLNWWIFPIGKSCEASRWTVCYQQGLPLLIFYYVGTLVDHFFFLQQVRF